MLKSLKSYINFWDHDAADILKICTFTCTFYKRMIEYHAECSISSILSTNNITGLNAK